METYIKYKRFEKEISDDDLPKFFDDLIKEGWQIISYKERRDSQPNPNNGYISSSLKIVILAGKKQDNSLSRVLWTKIRDI